MSLRIWRGPDAATQLEALAAASDVATTSYLPSPPLLDGQCTVAEQAVALAIAHGLAQPPELTDFVVDLLDADELLDKPTWHFSRGEQQIAGLVLAFARPFERLILIDPTAGLDARRATALVEFLVDLSSDMDVDVASDSDAFGPFSV